MEVLAHKTLTVIITISGPLCRWSSAFSWMSHNNLKGRFYDCHFTDEETKDQVTVCGVLEIT